MGLTLAFDRAASGVDGNRRRRVYDVTFDSSYPTTGESLTAADLGLRKVERVVPEGPAGDSDGTGGTLSVNVRYDYSSAKLQAYEGAASGASFAEVGSTDSLTNYLVRVTAYGW